MHSLEGAEAQEAVGDLAVACAQKAASSDAAGASQLIGVLINPRIAHACRSSAGHIRAVSDYVTSAAHKAAKAGDYGPLLAALRMTELWSEHVDPQESLDPLRASLAAVIDGTQDSGAMGKVLAVGRSVVVGTKDSELRSSSCSRFIAACAEMAAASTDGEELLEILDVAISAAVWIDSGDPASLKLRDVMLEAIQARADSGTPEDLEVAWRVLNRIDAPPRAVDLWNRSTVPSALAIKTVAASCEYLSDTQRVGLVKSLGVRFDEEFQAPSAPLPFDDALNPRAGSPESAYARATDLLEATRRVIRSIRNAPGTQPGLERGLATRYLQLAQATPTNKALDLYATAMELDASHGPLVLAQALNRYNNSDPLQLKWVAAMSFIVDPPLGGEPRFQYSDQVTAYRDALDVDWRAMAAATLPGYTVNQRNNAWRPPNPQDFQSLIRRL